MIYGSGYGAVAGGPSQQQKDFFAMSGATPLNKLAEEGARVNRAFNDTMKRLTAGGPNGMFDGFQSCMQAAQEYNAKVMEFAVANTTASFEYFRKLSEAKSTPEFVELATSHARSQFETITEQAKELQAICQKAMPTLPQK
jgi:hypothetical protein